MKLEIEKAQNGYIVRKPGYEWSKVFTELDLAGLWEFVKEELDK